MEDSKFDFLKVMEDTISGLLNLIGDYIKISWLILTSSYLDFKTKIIEHDNKRSTIGPYSFLTISLLLLSLVNKHTLPFLGFIDNRKDIVLHDLKNTNLIDAIIIAIPVIIVLTLWAILISFLLKESKSEKKSHIAILSYLTGTQILVLVLILIIRTLISNDLLIFLFAIILILFIFFNSFKFLKKHFEGRIKKQSLKLTTFLFILISTISYIAAFISVDSFLYSNKREVQLNNRFEILQSKILITDNDELILDIALLNKSKNHEVLGLEQGEIYFPQFWDPFDIDSTNLDISFDYKEYKADFRRINLKDSFDIFKPNEVKSLRLKSKFESELINKLNTIKGEYIVGKLKYDEFPNRPLILKWSTEDY